MVKFVVGKELLAYFPLSVFRASFSGVWKDSDEKGQEKHLCVPVRQGNYVCVGGSLGKGDRTCSLSTPKLCIYRLIKNRTEIRE